MANTDWLVASRIDRFRELNGLSLREFAEALGMPYRTIQNYLTGDVKIPAEFIHKSCRYFGVEIDFVFYAGIDFDRLAMAQTVSEIFGDIVDGLTVADGALKIRSEGKKPESDSVAEARRAGVLLHISAAIRDGYIDRRIDALGSHGWEGVHPDREGERWRFTQRRRTTDHGGSR